MLVPLRRFLPPSPSSFVSDTKTKIQVERLREELLGADSARTEVIEARGKLDALTKQAEGHARANEEIEAEVTTYDTMLLIFSIRNFCLGSTVQGLRSLSVNFLCLSTLPLSRSVSILSSIHPLQNYSQVPTVPSIFLSLSRVADGAEYDLFNLIRSVSQNVKAEKEIERLTAKLDCCETEAKDHEGQVGLRAEEGGGSITKHNV